MSLPITGNAALVLAVIFGAAFGALLHRGRVANYNTIINQFRLRDFTVLKVMTTAIIVGGLGVLALHSFGFADYHIKPANLLAVVVGSAMFGVGMAVYGYCPGTGVAAIGAGRIDALVGAGGMVVGGMIFGLTFDSIAAPLLEPLALGKIRLPDITGVPDIVWFAVFTAVALAGFTALERAKL